MLSAPAHPPEPDTPCPPRFRWLKRVVFFTLGFLLFLVLLRVAWGWHLGRKYDAVIAAARAAGEPVTLSELDARSSPADESTNAVPLLLKAAEEVKQKKPPSGLVGRVRRSVDTLRGRTEQRRRQGLTPEAVRLIREARTRPAVRWDMPVPHRRDRSEILSTIIEDQEGLARLLLREARQAHEKGDDAAAVEHVRDALFVAGALGECADQGPAATAGEITLDACAMIRRFAPTLRVGGASVAGEAPASAAQVDALIAELLEDERRLRQVDGALFAIRARFIEMRETLLDMGSWWLWELSRDEASPLTGVVSWGTRPVIEHYFIALMDFLQRTRRAIREPDWAAARALLRWREVKPAKTHLYPVDSLRATIYAMIDVHEYCASYRRIVADRRAAAMRLALRRYELDHAGLLPAALDELAPAYIPQVPRDPFGDGRRPFGYRPDAAVPFIYSLGANGRDDVAINRFKPKNWSNMHANPHDFPDSLYLLRPPPPKPKKAPAPPPLPPSQSSEDEDDEADADVENECQQHRP